MQVVHHTHFTAEETEGRTGELSKMGSWSWGPAGTTLGVGAGLAGQRLHLEGGALTNPTEAGQDIWGWGDSRQSPQASRTGCGEERLPVPPCPYLCPETTGALREPSVTAM